MTDEQLPPDSGETTEYIPDAPEDSAFPETLVSIRTDYSAFDNFEAAVAARVHYHMSQTDMSRENIEKLMKIVPQRFDFMLQKFADGQREHGGDFSQVDHTAEAFNEISDLFWYVLGPLLRRPSISVTL